MRKTFVGITLLLCAGCIQIPKWNTAERQAAEVELEKAQTQLEIKTTGLAGGMLHAFKAMVPAARHGR